MKFIARLRRSFPWLNLPGAILMMILQRTPAINLAVDVGETIIASPVGTMLKAALAAVSALGAVNTMVGATQLQATPSADTNGVTVQQGTSASVFFTVTNTISISSWNISGTIPAGMDFSGRTTAGIVNTSQLHLEGTPTAPGVYPVSIQAFEGSNGSELASDVFPYTITVTGPANVAPSFTTQPASQTVTAGNSVTFTAAASGTPTPTFQWRKDGNNINGATNSSFTIASTATGDAGTYTVVATNSVTSVASNGAVLTVNAAPVAPAFSLQPASQTVTAGNSVTFTAAASGTPAPTFQWRKDGNNINGATSSSFTIASTTAGDTGTYTVVATNSVTSTLSNGAVLTVNPAAVAPAITTQPASQTVVAGNSVTFIGGASGTPAPTFQWRKNNIDINGATGGSYTIASPVLGDAGSYTLVASNSAGAATSNGAVLTVNTGPSVTTQPVSQTIVGGSAVTFSVVASGTPAPTYQWQKEGMNIDGATGSTYTIGSTGGGDAGSYTVVVSNAVGTVTSAGATLTVVTADHPQVLGLYQKVLLRAVSGAELSALNTAMAGGGRSLPQVYADLLLSGEYQSRQLESVMRLYYAGLARPPDYGGLISWSEVLRTGQLTLVQVAQQFVQSAEFQGRYGSLSDTQFVQQMYRNVLGREADAGGLAFWVGQINGGASRGTVLAGFSESPEFQGLVAQSVEVERAYVLLLGSMPSYEQEVSWKESLNGADQTNTFLDSAEFTGQHPGGLDNATFVNVAFQGFLRRAVDPDGLNFWVGQLGGGQVTRAGLIHLLLQSGEFSDVVAPVYRFYPGSLGRLADINGLDGWVTFLRAGHSLSELAAEFAGSAEFQTQTGGLNNTAYVQQLYRNVLGREADPDGLNGWTSALNQGLLTRTDMLLQFEQSTEAVNLYTLDMRTYLHYVALLGRYPSTGELAIWHTYLSTLDEQFIQQLIDSPGF